MNTHLKPELPKLPDVVISFLAYCFCNKVICSLWEHARPRLYTGILFCMGKDLGGSPDWYSKQTMQVYHSALCCLWKMLALGCFFSVLIFMRSHFIKIVRLLQNKVRICLIWFSCCLYALTKKLFQHFSVHASFLCSMNNKHQGNHRMLRPAWHISGTGHFIYTLALV